MSCNDIVRESVQVVAGDGPGEVRSSSEGESPSFLSRLTDVELGRVAAFELAHPDCVYFWRFSVGYSEIRADCYSCNVSREIRRGGDTAA